MYLEKKLAEKYKKELSFFKSNNNTFRTSWLEMLQDLANTSESNWDFNDIRYQTVMSQKDWEAFAHHPQRRQYKSKIKSLPKTYNKKFEFIKIVLKDCYLYYRKLKASKHKNVLKKSIRSLLDYAINARYSTEIMRISDRYIGITKEQRDNGEIDPTTITLSKLDYAIYEYCRFSGKSYQQIRSKIYKLCDGRISILDEYYYSYRISEQLRNDLREIFKVFRRDQTLSFMNIRIGWEIWKIVREIGLDIDTYLEINDFPKYSTVEKRLLSFAKKKEFVEETLKHMKDELPKCYAEYKKIGHIQGYKLLAEESERKKRPRKIKTTEQTKKMITECKNEIYKYFPLAKIQTPTNLLLNPFHPESTSRAFQSTTKNIYSKNVNVIVMTPRSEPKEEYLAILAHETTHLIIRLIISMAETTNILPKGTRELMSSSVEEDFTQLVEHQFYKDTDLPYKKKFHGSEFPNFESARVTRAQVPYALTQLGIRNEFDKLWDSGYKEELSDEMIWKLKIKFDEKSKNWDTLGVNIIREGLTSFRLFSAKDPDDGLVYMKRYIVPPQNKKSIKTETTKSTQINMSQAFLKRFGNNWVESKEARTILLWLFLESGRNHKTEKFGPIILDKEPAECMKELTKIGITAKDI